MVSRLNTEAAAEETRAAAAPVEAGASVGSERCWAIAWAVAGAREEVVVECDGGKGALGLETVGGNGLCLTWQRWGAEIVTGMLSITRGRSMRSLNALCY